MANVIRTTALARAAQALVCTLAALPAAAQQAAPPQETQRVEITGSSIKRTDAETALPVQVISREEIQRSGAVNTEELLKSVAALASSGQITASGAAGATTGGISSVSLRGLTSVRTLVLLNGRRIAPYGIGFTGDSVSVDVNSIPLAAIERVEVLKDGASAVYGSDAVAGVINFILRKDYVGGELGLDVGRSQHGGADADRVTASWGTGDLTTDRYNLMLVGMVQREGALFGRDRDFARRSYSLSANNDNTSAHTFPANLIVLDSVGNAGNPAAPACPGPYALNTPFTDGSGLCAFDPSPMVGLLPKTNRASLFGSAHFMLGENTEAFIEASYNRNEINTVIQPVPFSFIFALPPNNPLYNLPPYNGFFPDGTPTGLTPGTSTIIMMPSSPYYPAAYVRTLMGNPNDPLPPITILYRSAVTGMRDITDISESPRLAGGLRGTLGDWDYETALLLSSSRVREHVNGGFPANSKILPILNSGNVNFWGPNTPDIDAQLRDTNYIGDAYRVRSDLTSLTGHVSRDLMPLGGGALALALGAEWRDEKYLFDPSPTIQSGDISGYGGNFLVTDRSRQVGAAYVELVAPLLKSLELNAAVRYDRYQGVGASTTPKLSLRWQPVSELVLRGSVGKGFRAPSLQDLYLPNTTGVTPSGLSDPLRCPTTGSASDCSTQFNVLFGGNAALDPERSTNMTLGAVIAPTNKLSLSMDFFKIDLKDTIVNGVAPAVILGDLSKYGSLVTRGPADPNFPGLPGPIVQINQTNINLGESRVSGIDADARATWPLGDWGKLSATASATYFIKFDVQNPDGSFTGGVDVTNSATSGVVPRWKHRLALDWDIGHWGFTLAESFQKHYHDLPATNDPATAKPRTVADYDIWDGQLRYSGFKSTMLKFGVRNLFDRDPPYSNAGGGTNFQGGYDATYADPRGRFFYVAAEYQFK
ncbi:MAG: TonB-dependent receptor [Burkholderiaceae bacterium]